jgi:hypothetical protein
MAYQISSTTVIDDNRKATFTSMNPGTSSSDPGSPSTGDIYYNTSTGTLKVYNGSAWISI